MQLRTDLDWLKLTNFRKLRYQPLTPSSDQSGLEVVRPALTSGTVLKYLQQQDCIARHCDILNVGLVFLFYFLYPRLCGNDLRDYDDFRVQLHRVIYLYHNGINFFSQTNLCPSIVPPSHVAIRASKLSQT